MSESIPKYGKVLDTSNVLDTTYRSLTEALTGIAAADRKEIALSVGHIFQKLRGWKFLDAFKEEWNAYREKGRIKDDYISSEQHQECLQELLDFLDQGSVDEKRFDLLKRILLGAASEIRSPRDSVLPQQYMRIVRSLTAGEALVLMSTYSIARNRQAAAGFSQATEWLKQVADSSGLQFLELVAIHEENLIDKGLLLPRSYGDKSGVMLGNHFRLTNLGISLCKFVESYEPISSSPSAV